MKTNYSIVAPASRKAAQPETNRLGAALSGLLKLGGRLSTKRKNMMHLCETLSLGEKRFLAVVTVDEQKFLVGGAGNSVALLAEINGRKQKPRTDRNEVHLL